MSINISVGSFTNVATAADQKLALDKNTDTIIAKNVSWQGKLVNFLQNIPVLNKLVPPNKGDVATQAIFLQALSAKYGEEVVSTLLNSASTKVHLNKPLTEYSVKAVVDFAEHKTVENQQKLIEGHTTRLQAKYAAVYGGEIQDAVHLWAQDTTLNKILTPDEYVSVRTYTGDDYRPINAALRTEDPQQLASWKPLIDDAKQGLDKLAQNGYNYDKLLVRGTVIAKDNAFVSVTDYQEGKVVADKAFVSTTHDMSVAKKFSGVSNSPSLINQNPTEDKLLLHLFIGKSGAQVETLSNFNNEKEVLVKPGTQFNVLFNAYDQKTNAYKVIMANTSLPATHGSQRYADALTDSPAKKYEELQRPSPWLDLA